MARAVAAAMAPVLVALLVALPATGASAPRRPASLKLASLAPLAVTGRDFGARETVLVTYVGEAGSSRLASARATAAGRLRATFRIRVGQCDSFTVRAIGTAGSRAVLQVQRGCEQEKAPPEEAPREKPRKPRG